MKVTVSGGRDLVKFAHALREARLTGLKSELDRGIRAAAQEVIDEVRAHTNEYMPKGYEKTFAQSLKLKAEVRLIQSHRVSIVGTAGGKGRARDVRRMEEGTLRHPVFGRRRVLKSGKTMANPWVPQRIRPHFFAEPAARAVPKVRERIDEAVGRVAAKIGRAS